MTNEQYNSVEDLVFSRSFRNWVLKGDCPEAGFWSDWTARNPDKTSLVDQARAVIAALELNLKPLSAAAIEAEREKVLRKLKDNRFNGVREIPFRPGLRSSRPARAWAIAALLAALFILSWALQLYLHRQHHPAPPTYHGSTPGLPSPGDKPVS